MRATVKFKEYDLEIEYEATPYRPARMYPLVQE